MRKNLIALYGVQAATLILPLLTIPFLARSLGPSSLGQLAAIQSLFATLGFIIEYGFNFSAVNQVSINRANTNKLTSIFGNVTGAKILLSVLYLFVSLMIYLSIPVFREDPLVFWVAFAGGLTQGFTLIWFFQGIEKISIIATIDIIFKFAYVLLVIVLVKSSNDLLIVVTLQFVTSLASLITGIFIAKKYINRPTIKLSGALSSIKEGGGMFFFRGLTLLRTTASSAILRIFVPSASVAYYANAEKLTNVSYSAFTPLNQVFFPRISYLVHHEFESAKVQFRKYLKIIFLMSVVSSILAYILAPVAVEIIFGPQYLKTIDIFRIILLSIPIVSINTLFGIQWLAITGRQKYLNISTATSAVLSIALIATIVPIHGMEGMAWIMVASEFIMMLMILFYSLNHSTNPFRKNSVLIDFHFRNEQVR
ncbi:oligosaccharide flippase family protein [Deinococcus sp. UR1]|uniref:oligosaccharide flippase family protein n=1 Tax=Deinococcus sp. UR1 TaxID=1704277 RepID=UPI000B07DC83|nr:oligosaccharide flippase family protein [Deinococcus sp. UR1]PIG99084.1 hypothetical protein AMD26_004825 [Deinococcus sp. UR1]